MARKSSALEFRRPRRRFVAARRRQSKFRPRGLTSKAYGPQAVPASLRYWMAFTMLVPFLAWACMTIFR